MKRIDNSRVVRAADPAARGRCWKLIGSVVGAAVLLIGVLLPSSYGLMAGYSIQSLRQEGQRLDADQASLELREAQLLSPARIEELAREQQFVDPAAGQGAVPGRRAGLAGDERASKTASGSSGHAGNSIHPPPEVAPASPAGMDRGHFYAAGVAAGIPP